MRALANTPDNYPERKIGLHLQRGVMVSTVRAYDSIKPYETAVRHPAYEAGRTLIVQTYDTEDEARKGHIKWMETMTTYPPDEIPDLLQEPVLVPLVALGYEGDRLVRRSGYSPSPNPSCADFE